MLEPKPIKNLRGHVEHLEYRCVNAESGCSYVIQSNVMMIGEMKVLREDGSLARIP